MRLSNIVVLSKSLKLDSYVLTIIINQPHNKDKVVYDFDYHHSNQLIKLLDLSFKSL